MANPTDARTVALEFHRAVFGKVVSSKVAQSVVQASRLLDEGHDVDDILLLIDYIQRHTSANMYSIGYVGAVIDDLLPKAKLKAQYEQQKRAQDELARKAREMEVTNDSERNRDKAKQFGRKQKESDFSGLF